MSFTFGFYNALNHDRRYNAIEMSRIFDGLLTDGVYPTIGNRMMVRASGTDNSVIVGSGRAWFDHSWNYNDADIPLTGPASHVLYPRWDAIVLDINSSIEYRTNSIIWVTGMAASSPVKPTMVHTETHNQYPLAYIYRPANDNTIPADRITNPIGTAECPYAGGLLVDRKNIAQIENNDHATKAYAQGEYLIWYDQLYKVTMAISQGAAIVAYPTSGYNVMRTTIAEELYQKFVFDTTPTSGSTHPLTSDGIYKALGNNKIIQPTTTVNQNDPTNGKAVITSKGLYAALGNRTKIPDTSAPAANGTNLISNGQVYTALGNRTSIQTSAPTQNSSNLITSGQVWTALGNRANLPTAFSAPASGGTNMITNGQVYTALGNRASLPTAFSAPASGGNNMITNGQVYTALGNRTKIETSAPTQNSNNLITSGQVWAALGNRSSVLKMQVVEKRIGGGDREWEAGDTFSGKITYTGQAYTNAIIAGYDISNDHFAVKRLYCTVYHSPRCYDLHYCVEFVVTGRALTGEPVLTVYILEIYE